MATLPENPVSTAEIKIDISEEKKFNFMEKFKNTVQFDKAELVTIDGIRVEFVDGWGLLRASNTSPCLVSRFEADTIEALLRIQKDFKNQILSIDEEMNVPF
jgi:phosphomannomutase